MVSPLDTRGVIGPALEQADNIRRARIQTTLADMALQDYPAQQEYLRKTRAMDIEGKGLDIEGKKLGISGQKTAQEQSQQNYLRQQQEYALKLGMNSLGYTNTPTDYHDWYRMMMDKGVDQSWLPVPPDKITDKEYPAWRDRVLNMATEYENRLKTGAESQKQQFEVKLEDIRTRTDRERYLTDLESKFNDDATEAYRFQFYEQFPVAGQPGVYQWVETSKEHPTLEEYQKQYVNVHMRMARSRVNDMLNSEKTSGGSQTKTTNFADFDH